MQTIDHAAQPVRQPMITPTIAADEIRQLKEEQKQKRRSESGTQLVAQIKRSSKYFGQGKEGARFPVAIQSDSCGYVVLGGPGGQYRLADVNLFAVIGDSQVKLT